MATEDRCIPADPVLIETTEQIIELELAVSGAQEAAKKGPLLMSDASAVLPPPFETHLSLVTKVATLDARMVGLESSVRNIETSISTLVEKIDRRSQTSWGPIWTALGVMVGAGGLILTIVVQPIDASVTKNASKIEAIREDIVPRREHEREWAIQDKLMDGMETRLRYLETEMMRPVQSR